MKRQKGQIQPSLECITEPLTGILSIPVKDLKSNNVRHLRAARAPCGVLWSRVGWADWGIGK